MENINQMLTQYFSIVPLATLVMNYATISTRDDFIKQREHSLKRKREIVQLAKNSTIHDEIINCGHRKHARNPVTEYINGNFEKVTPQAFVERNEIICFLQRYTNYKEIVRRIFQEQRDKYGQIDRCKCFEEAQNEALTFLRDSNKITSVSIVPKCLFDFFGISTA